MAATKAERKIGPDDVVPDYVALRSFKFDGRVFQKDDPITVAVYQHRRFETLIHTGHIKAVRR